MKKLLFSLVAMIAAGVYADGVYVLQVNSDQTDFTAEQVTAIESGEYTEIRKTGTGTLRVTETGAAVIGNFTGTIRVSDGVWQLACTGTSSGVGPLGRTGQALVIVEDGATVMTDVYLGINHTSYFGGTRIEIAGSGYNSQGALLVGGATDGAYKGFYLCSWHIKLNDDAVIARGPQNAYCAGGGTIDLDEHKLTVKNSFGFEQKTVNVPDTITSSGTLVFDGSAAKEFNVVPLQLASRDVEVKVELWGNAQIKLYNDTTATPNLFDCRLEANGTSDTSLSVSAYDTTAVWRGDINLAGNCVAGGYSAGKSLTLSGDIGGSGRLIAYHGAEDCRLMLSGTVGSDVTVENKRGVLVLMNKNAMPDLDGGKLIGTDGSSKTGRAICFAKKTAQRDGWTGAEVWALIKKFRFKTNGSNRNWGIGVYTEDDFIIDCDFTEGAPNDGIYNDFSGMSFLTLGGGRGIIRGGYPAGMTFKPFRTWHDAGTHYKTVYMNRGEAAALGGFTVVNHTVTLENLGYVDMGEWNYMYATGVNGQYDYPGRLVVGAGTVVDAANTSGGKPIYIGGDGQGNRGAVTLLPGGIISNGLWNAIKVEYVGAGQIGSFLMKGGEFILKDRVTSNLMRMGWATNSLAYMEVDGGTVYNNSCSFNIGHLAPNAHSHFCQKGGDIDLLAMRIGFRGFADFRLKGGTFRVNNLVYAPANEGGAGAFDGGDVHISFENGAKPWFVNGLVLCDNEDSKSTVALAGGALLKTPFLKKAYTTSMWRHDVLVNSVAKVGFNGGGLEPTADGEILGAGNEAVDATVFAGGALFNVPEGVVSTCSAPLKAPTGSGLATITIPAARHKNYTAAPTVVIEGDGSGAVAMVDYDPDREDVTGVTITAPGCGYTSATAYLYCGGPTTNIPLTVTFAANAATGGLVKRGAGELVLNAVNTFGGAVDVEAGTLTAAVAGALPAGATINLKGGLLKAGTGVTLPGEFTVDATGFTGSKRTLVDYNGNAPGALPTINGLDGSSPWRCSLVGDKLIAKRVAPLMLMVR